MAASRPLVTARRHAWQASGDERLSTRPSKAVDNLASGGPMHAKTAN